MKRGGKASETRGFVRGSPNVDRAGFDSIIGGLFFGYSDLKHNSKSASAENIWSAVDSKGGMFRVIRETAFEKPAFMVNCNARFNLRSLP